MSSSDAPSSKKFDVFISFRGEDTRDNFTSHLSTAFEEKGIRRFIDDMLKKGEDVWPVLANAIEESQLSVVVFSENYAGSKWCLEELVKILECRKGRGHVVIPVFYKISPSVVRKQIGSYGEAFAQYEGDFPNNKSNRDKVSKWRSALTEAANISGWDSTSRINKDESQVIRNVVNDVVQKLYLRYPKEINSQLVPVDKKCEEIESLMKTSRRIGIWGMGGIGKTTVAKVLFAKLFARYDAVCFLANVGEESQRIGLTSLRDKLIFELLKEESSKPDVQGSVLNTERLKSQKVFVILDDVDSGEQLESLCGECRGLGRESRLLVTSRDWDLLNKAAEKIYDIRKWEDPASLRLFCLNAFKENHPKTGFEDLSKEAIKYAKGVPLALKVLGSLLYSQSIAFWKSELHKLTEYANKDIQSILEVSYNGLDETQQDIFLDIAFFFIDEDKDFVTKILNACGFYADSGIVTLQNKALITISANNRIQMHDLFQEMGLDIVRKESKKNPGRRSRLKNIEEVSKVLQRNEGTAKVEGITLDLSQIKDLQVKAKSFNRMPNLRFLKLHVPSGKISGGVHLVGALESISDELKYFEWSGYPLKSPPQNFCAKRLVEFRMPHSLVTELWCGVQELMNLERIDLSECTKLMKLPDLSKASKLTWMNLCGCESLHDLHPSILSNDTLVTLLLDGCKNLKSLTSERLLSSLKHISVNGCTRLTEFSVSSESIKELDLRNTGIQKLHSSIRLLKNIMSINLEGLRLTDLPNELAFLTSLTDLRISNSGTVINKQDLHDLFEGLRSLRILYLKDCPNLFELPDNISILSSLHELQLDGTSVKTLPESIKDLKELQILSLVNCGELQSLPELPQSILRFYAINCTALVTVSTLKTFATEMSGKRKSISFMNDGKLNESSLGCIIEGAQLTMMSVAFHNVFVRRYGLNAHSYNYDAVEVCLPANRVPQQESTHRTTKSSITLELPSRTHLLGLMLFAVLSPSPEMKEHGAKIFCQCYADGEDVGYATRWSNEAVTELNSDHVFAWYDPRHCDSIFRSDKQELSFEFYVTDEMEERDRLKISTKECGVRLIFDSELEYLLRELDLESESKFELGKRLGPLLELGLVPDQLELKLKSWLGLGLAQDQVQLELESQVGQKTRKGEIGRSVAAKSDTGTDQTPNTPSREREESISTDGDQIGEPFEVNPSDQVPVSAPPRLESSIRDLPIQKPLENPVDDPVPNVEPMSSLDIPAPEAFDKNPLDVVESILSESSIIFSTNTAVGEALHNLECLLENSLESLLNDEQLCQQLESALDCLEEAKDDVAVEMFQLVNAMKSSMKDLKNYTVAQKVVEEHQKRLNKKARLIQQTLEARKREEQLDGKISKGQSEVKRLAEEIADLNHQIRAFEDRRIDAETKQDKLKKDLKECEGEKTKIWEDAMPWIRESEEVMSAIEGSKVSYKDALSEQRKRKEKWENFGRDLANLKS